MTERAGIRAAAGSASLVATLLLGAPIGLNRVVGVAAVFVGISTDRTGRLPARPGR